MCEFCSIWIRSSHQRCVLLLHWIIDVWPSFSSRRKEARLLIDYLVAALLRYSAGLYASYMLMVWLLMFWLENVVTVNVVNINFWMWSFYVDIYRFSNTSPGLAPNSLSGYVHCSDYIEYGSPGVCATRDLGRAKQSLKTSALWFWNIMSSYSCSCSGVRDHLRWTIEVF